VGFYRKHILPKLIDCACAMKQRTKQRRKMLALASGRVLDIGIGSGLNLPLYDAAKVTDVIRLDPDKELRANVQRRQDRPTPLWQRLAVGCHLNPDIAALLRAAGFRIDSFESA
jgi:hypothetical protein